MYECTDTLSFSLYRWGDERGAQSADRWQVCISMYAFNINKCRRVRCSDVCTVVLRTNTNKHAYCWKMIQRATYFMCLFSRSSMQTNGRMRVGVHRVRMHNISKLPTQLLWMHSTNSQRELDLLYIMIIRAPCFEWFVCCVMLLCYYWCT